VGAKPTTLEHEHEQGSRSKTPLVIAGVVWRRRRRD